MSGIPEIVVGYDNDLKLIIKKQNSIQSIPSTSTLTIVLATTGKTQLAGPIVCDFFASGANWLNGIVVTSFSPSDLQGINEEQDCIIEMKETTSTGKIYPFYGICRVVKGVH